MPLIDIAIPLPLNKTFTYHVSVEEYPNAKPGVRVIVPFRNRQKIGFVLESGKQGNDVSKIKEVSRFPDKEPLFTEEMIKLIRWMSEYYCAPIGEFFSAALPSVLCNPREIDKQRRKIDLNIDYGSYEKKKSFSLTKAQKEAWNKIQELINKSNFSPILLHGITGSGKTELYIKTIENVHKRRESAIVLVPEISLIPQMAGRLKSYFKEPIAIYHSGLTEVQRYNQWKLIKSGEALIVVGTRSAIFAPLENLGLIIIDEEHDNSYKQDESPRYNARDVAMMRGKIERAAVILGSATPSFESLYNAKYGKYHYVTLGERYGEAKLPNIEIVDMRKEVRSKLLNPNLSINLLTAIKNEINKGHQSILFLNRRGYSNFIICRECGYIPKCLNCEISLTFHKSLAKLRCHYCNYEINGLDTCPNCKGIELENAGSGTEMIEEVLKDHIPSVKIKRLDRDSVTTDKKRRKILDEMKSGDIDILIGTQMITKGHDFPDVTLVGIISADQSMNFPDYKSAEKTFQLITQVSGRAGRDIKPGRVIIQSYNPESLPIISAVSGKVDEFLETEMNQRKSLSYPPFSRLANIRISGNKRNYTIQTAKNISTILKKIDQKDKLAILGPAPAPLFMMKGKTRWQILIKSPSSQLLSGTLHNLNRYLEENSHKGVRISIDVDPVSIM